MSEKWTGEIVAALHINKITQRELARELNLREEYVSAILSGARSPRGAKERMEAAICSIASKRVNREE